MTHHELQELFSACLQADDDSLLPMLADAFEEAGRTVQADFLRNKVRLISRTQFGRKHGCSSYWAAGEETYWPQVFMYRNGSGHAMWHGYGVDTKIRALGCRQLAMLVKHCLCSRSDPFELNAHDEVDLTNITEFLPRSEWHKYKES